MTESKDLEEYNEWESARGSFWSNFKKSFTPFHAVSLAALILLGFYLLQTTSGSVRNLIFGVMILVVLVMIWRGKEKTEKVPIPKHIASFLACRYLTKQVGTEYPFGTQIVRMQYGSLRYEGEWGAPFRPWKWEVGIKIIYPNRRIEYVLVALHPYDGYITKILGKPAGYFGEESTDLKVLIPSTLTIQEEKAKSPSDKAKT